MGDLFLCIVPPVSGGTPGPTQSLFFTFATTVQIVTIESFCHTGIHSAERCSLPSRKAMP